MRKINTRSFVRATRSTPRKINRQILLNLVREHQPLSRAELARRMRVGRGMVTSLVGELLSEGSIYEGESVDAPRGRRPKMLHVRTRDRYAVAVDVRFSRTSVMLSDFAGTEIALETFDSVTAPEAFVAALAPRIARLLRAHKAVRRCEGIGLVVPGMVDHDTGRVLNAPQLGWRDVDIRDALARATGLRVHVENAPVACALAKGWMTEHADGVAADFVYVTVSDGVGACTVVRGEVVRGHGFAAGEFGHVPLSLDGPACLCGARGCLEAYTSNLATLSRYLGQPFSPTTARTVLQESGITMEDLISKASGGEARARSALLETARYLGVGLATIINAVNPSQIFVGGEITEAWDQVESTIRDAIRSRALTPAAAATPVIPDPAASHPRLRGGTALVAAPEFAAPTVA